MTSLYMVAVTEGYLFEAFVGRERMGGKTVKVWSVAVEGEKEREREREG